MIDSEFAKESVVDHGEVRFENVTFAYEPSKPIIENLYLLAEAGKTIAIVGESGVENLLFLRSSSGFTTYARDLLR